MSERVVAPAAWTAQPWKNGRGVTHEIWRWTDPATDSACGFDLRLSVASIDGEQEFSLFPGYWRALIALDESALTLGSMPIAKHTVISFPGDVATGTRGSGKTRDLNVMSRIARARAHVEISTTCPHARARHLAVFALSPTTLRDAQGHELEFDALETWIHLDHGDAALTGSAPVVWIRF